MLASISVAEEGQSANGETDPRLEQIQKKFGPGLTEVTKRTKKVCCQVDALTCTRVCKKTGRIARPSVPLRQRKRIFYSGIIFAYDFLCNIRQSAGRKANNPMFATFSC